MSIKAILHAAGVAVTLLAGTASHAALLNLQVQNPTIEVAAGGVIAYNATAGVVTISGTPQILQQLMPFLFAEFQGTEIDDERLVTIQFKVDSAGRFVSGVDGPDLVIKGAVDTNFDGVPDHDGVLLEAEVTAFGFADGVAGANDRFDLRLTPTGGLLAFLYAGRQLAVTVDGEPSADYPNAFSGSFTADFVGLAKAVVGAAEIMSTAPCRMNVRAFCAVNGGPDRQVCRIQVTKSPKHWEPVGHERMGHTFKVLKYGMHGAAVPAWTARQVGTQVRFRYVVTNTGPTPVNNLQLIDSFDTDPSGGPSLLAPGASYTFTRTESLHEGLVNMVLATGESGGQMCMAQDSVAVKDKVRKKRQHDDDRYLDKRARDDSER